MITINDGVVHCPRCGSEHLHHDEVITYARHEDAEETLVAWTSAQQGTVSVETLKSARSGNPSPRRSGLSIGFWCEDCERVSRLTLGQHKGESLMAWEAV